MRAIERTNSHSENEDMTEYQHSYSYDRITAACKRHPFRFSTETSNLPRPYAYALKG